MGEPVPNCTVYCRNLNEKMSKTELTRNVYHMFSQFGPIVNVYVNKTLKLRGQAWIAFEKVESATRAIRKMNNFTFLGKEMSCTYARVKSDVISKKDGSFVPRQKRKMDTGNDDGKAAVKESKKKAAIAPKTSNSVPVAEAVTPAMPENPPNKQLFCQNLPESCTDMMLGLLFRQYPGFVDARMALGGIAFVEFQDKEAASVARDGLQGFLVTEGFNLKISFAK